MSEPIKQILRFIIFILAQAMILNYMAPLHRFITPYFYFLFILWLPFSTGRISLLVIAFFTGFTLDLFTHSPGLHASSCVLIAYIRPFIINILVPKETKELKLGSPSKKTMGFAPYALYVALLTLFHHGLLVFIEWMSFAGIVYFLGKVLFTTLISLLLILITEMLFANRGRRLAAA